MEYSKSGIKGSIMHLHFDLQNSCLREHVAVFNISIFGDIINLLLEQGKDQ